MTRRIARKSALWLLSVLMMSGPAGAQENLPRLIKSIQPAVVTIIGYHESGKIIRLGSGFFVSPQGQVITNGHVLFGVSRAEAKTLDGRRFPLKMVVAEDRGADLVKLAGENLPGPVPYLKISGARPEVGERVLVIGSPLGLEQTVSDGMVSGIRNIPGRGKILQISAPVSPGSSGGPVVNLKGEVMGVATFQLGRGQNLNFAVPASRVLAMREGPPRPLGAREDRGGPRKPAMKPSLPPRPKVQVPRPRLQLPKSGEPQPLPQRPPPEPLGLAPEGGFPLGPGAPSSRATPGSH